MTAYLNFERGDASMPLGTGPVLIAHLCNDRGGWGRGFVTSLSRRWKSPEAAFRRWAVRQGRADDGVFALGAVQFVGVEARVTVANMVVCQGTAPEGGIPPIRWSALGTALGHVGDRALASGAVVQMPRIGCGFAGGDWPRVEPLVRTHLLDRGVSVTVFDLPGGKPVGQIA